MLKKPVRITIQIPAATFERLERGEEDSMARIVRQTLEIGLTEMGVIDRARRFTLPLPRVLYRVYRGGGRAVRSRA